MQNEKERLPHKQNLHTHTSYTDGIDTPEEMILTAIEKGFDSIGFSEHTMLKYSPAKRQLTDERFALYKSEIAALKEKYRGRIGVYCGLEYEYYSEVDTDGLDYLIGSVHYLDVGGEILGFDRGLEETLNYVKNNFGADGLSFAKRYFETVMMLPSKKSFDILGHFDILTKNNEMGGFIDISDTKYLNYGFEAIDAIKGKIPFFEVNTGAISRGYRSLPYPAMDFLKEFKRQGYGALITSDCHNRIHLDCAYDMARELLIAAGFRSKWILTDGGFTEVSL